MACNTGRCRRLSVPDVLTIVLASTRKHRYDYTRTSAAMTPFSQPMQRTLRRRALGFRFQRGRHFHSFPASPTAFTSSAFAAGHDCRQAARLRPAQDDAAKAAMTRRSEFITATTDDIISPRMPSLLHISEIHRAIDKSC